LTISEAGKVHLEILGSFSGPTGSVEDLKDETLTIGRVVGQIEKEGMLTLEHCFYRKLPYGFGGVIKSKVEASWAILGVAFDADEDILSTSSTPLSKASRSGFVFQGFPCR